MIIFLPGEPGRQTLNNPGPVRRGQTKIPTFQIRELDACRSIIDKYSDQDLGATDASLVVYAEMYKTTTIATFDRRHFTVLRSSKGEPFTLLP